MNVKNLKTMFELYLSSIEPELSDNSAAFTGDEDTVPESDLDSLGLITSIDFARIIENNLPAEAEPLPLPGGIRAMEESSGIIQFLIVEKDGNDYLCLKASQFTIFAAEEDVLVQTDGPGYLVESCNRFLLSEREVGSAVMLCRCEALSLMEVQSVIHGQLAPNAIKKLKPKLTGDLSAYTNRFRIMEYELTRRLRFRGRESKTPVWIPQVELQINRGFLDQLPFAAADADLELAYNLIRPKDEDSVYYAPTHTLALEPSKAVLMIPDDKLVGQKARIYCGAFCVFEGFLPKSLYLLPQAFAPLHQIQSILEITIEITDSPDAI